MTQPAPTFKKRDFKTEVAIADRKDGQKPAPPETGYEFSGGRKFDDKVSKNKSYD